MQTRAWFKTAKALRSTVNRSPVHRHDRRARRVRRPPCDAVNKGEQWGGVRISVPVAGRRVADGKLSRCLPVLRSTPTIAGGHRRSKDTSQETRNRPFSRSALDNVARFIEHRPQANHRRELVNRSEFCARIADRSSLSSADAASAVTAVISTITEALARGETVTIAGFGRFATKDRAARVARNPRSGEAVPVAASRVPTFKAGKTLRDAVDE